MTPDEKSDAQRLDKWLWHVRFYKTRSLATAAIVGGKVHLNAERVKPAHRVRVGDRLSLSLQGIVAEFEVLGLPLRRGPAADAQAHYRETPASSLRRGRTSAIGVACCGCSANKPERPGQIQKSAVLSGSSNSQMLAVSGCSVSHCAFCQTAVAIPPVGR